jgi:hypothetical protein
VPLESSSLTTAPRVASAPGSTAGPNGVLASIVASRLAANTATTELRLDPPRRDAVALTVMVACRALLGIVLVFGAVSLNAAARELDQGSVGASLAALELWRVAAIGALGCLALVFATTAWWADVTVENYDQVRRTAAAPLRSGARRWWVWLVPVVTGVAVHMAPIPFRTEPQRLAMSGTLWVLVVAPCLAASLAVVRPVLVALSERLLSIRLWLVAELALVVGLLMFWDQHLDDADGLHALRGEVASLTTAARWWFVLGVVALFGAASSLACAAITRRAIVRRRAEIERPDIGAPLAVGVLVPSLLEQHTVGRRLLTMTPYIVGLAIGHVAWGLIRIAGSIGLFQLRGDLGRLSDDAGEAIALLRDYSQVGFVITGVMFALHGVWVVVSIVNTRRAALHAPPLIVAIAVVVVPIALVVVAATVESRRISTVLLVGGAVAGLVCFSASFRLLASCAKAVDGDVNVFRTWSLVVTALYVIQAVGVLLSRQTEGGEAVGLAIVLEASSGLVVLISAAIGVRAAVRLDDATQSFRQRARRSIADVEPVGSPVVGSSATGSATSG